MRRHGTDRRRSSALSRPSRPPARTASREAGGDALPDYELLELVLFRSIPRRDVKPLAKALIAPLRLLRRSARRAGRPG